MLKYFAAVEATELGAALPRRTSRDSEHEDVAELRGPGSVLEEQRLVQHLQSAIEKNNPDNPFKKGKVTGDEILQL